MKVLVFGHSNSDGSRLPNPNDAWPWLLRRMLGEAGMDIEVVHRPLFAGPAAAAMVRGQLEQESPEVVILATSTYGVAVRLISNEIRRRWGKRAAALAYRGEQFVARHFMGRSSLAARSLRPARRLARRTIGTRATHSTAALIGYYQDCFSVLAQHEDVATIILGGVGYGPAVDRSSPGWRAPQDIVYAALKEDARRRRFDWLVLEELLGGPTEKLQYFHRDGVHTNEASHRIAAEALLPLVAPRVSSL